MVNREYQTGYVVGNNKGINDGNLLVNPYPYTEYGDEDYQDGYRNGYLRGYVDRVKEMEPNATKEDLKLINNQLKKICDIFIQKTTPSKLK